MFSKVQKYLCGIGFSYAVSLGKGITEYNMSLIINFSGLYTTSVCASEKEVILAYEMLSVFQMIFLLNHSHF